MKGYLRIAKNMRKIPKVDAGVRVLYWRCYLVRRDKKGEDVSQVYKNSVSYEDMILKTRKSEREKKRQDFLEQLSTTRVKC